jgi:hypothetical protein
MRNALFSSVFIFASPVLDDHPLGKDSLEFSGDKLVLRLRNQHYRLSSVRNDLHIAEFFEPVFAEFNANP